MEKRKIYVRIPVEITREGLRNALIKLNHPQKAANEMLLDKMLYMIAEIHRVSIRNFFENENGVEMTHLHSKYLKGNLGRAGKVTYKDVVDALLLVDAIEMVDSYRMGNYSKSYGIKNRNKLLHVYKCELKFWQPKPRKGSLESTGKGWNLLETIVSNISKVEVDRSYVLLVNMHQVNLYSILNMHYNINASDSPTTSFGLKRKDIIDVRIISDDYGRVHHNLTGVGRKYRPAFNIGGENIFSTDLSASQMYFSLKGLKSYAKMKARTKDWVEACKKLPDVPKFIDAVLKGQFYSSINQYLNFTEEEMKANKVNTLMPLFSKKDPKRRTKYHKALEEVFPTFLSYINTKKRKDYADAARFLQAEESAFMIEKVCARLAELGIWFVPIHDCILSREIDLPLVRAIIEEEGNAYNGYKPHMKSTNWTGSRADLQKSRTQKERTDFLKKNTLDYRERQKREVTNRVVNAIKRKRKLREAESSRF
jgi:hypothetical protein